MTTMRLHRDEQRLRLFQAIEAIKIGNKTDDKLIVSELHKAGYCIAHVDAEADAFPSRWLVTYKDGEENVFKHKISDYSLGVINAIASPLYDHPQPAAQKVVVDFDQVGLAGPFSIINGRIKLPKETMQDMFRMAFGHTAAQDAVSVSDEDVTIACDAYDENRDEGGLAEFMGMRAALESLALGKAAQPSVPVAKLKAIADDYIPDNKGQEGQALEEFRDALKSLIAEHDSKEGA
jgi:hypothetical protein